MLFGAADIDFVADKYIANHSGLDHWSQGCRRDNRRQYYVTALAHLPYLKPGQRLWIVQVPSRVVGGTSVTTVTVGDYSTTFTTKTVQ